MSTAKEAATALASPENRCRRLGSFAITSAALGVIHSLCASALSGSIVYIPQHGVLVPSFDGRYANMELKTRPDNARAQSATEHSHHSSSEADNADGTDRWCLVRLLRRNAYFFITEFEYSANTSMDDSALQELASSVFEKYFYEPSKAFEFACTTRGGGRGWNWWFPGRRAQRKRNLVRAGKGSESGGEDRETLGLPSGLANQANTCYLNSLLQSVYHAPGLKEAVLEAAGAGEGGETVSALAKVFRQLDERGRPASTRALTKAMGLDPRVQQDAQEFGRFLFMALERECNGESKAKGRDAKSSDGRDEEAKGLYRTIDDLFGGRLVNYLECVDVPFAKEGEEIFYDLPLDVKGSGVLERALDKFTAAELLTGENMWRVKEHGLQKARKGVRFVEFPRVLQFHLKRFEYDPSRDGLAKINDRFEFPTELDVSPWLQDAHPHSTPDSGKSVHSEIAEGPALPATATESYRWEKSDGPNRSRRYLLSAVVMHMGTPTVGHYYAYVRTKKAAASSRSTNNCSNQSEEALSPPRAGEAGGARWVKLDDERVTEVSEEEVLRDAFGGQGGSQGGGRKDWGLGPSKLLVGQVGGGLTDGCTASAYMLQYVREDTSSLLHPLRPSEQTNQASENPQP